MTGFTYYKGVFNYNELIAYINCFGDLPECESFKYRVDGDEKIAKNGYIAEELFDDDVWKEVPDNLFDALGKTYPQS